MNTCAFLLLLAVQIYAEGIEGPTGKEPFLPVFKSLRTWEAMHPVWRVLNRCIDPEKGPVKGVAVCFPQLTLFIGD